MKPKKGVVALTHQGRQTVDESDEESLSPRWKILYTLNAQRRPLKPSELAQFSRMDPTTVASLVSSLESEGMVEVR